jgi:hypothetical protein
MITKKASYDRNNAGMRKKKKDDVLNFRDFRSLPSRFTAMVQAELCKREMGYFVPFLRLSV